MECKEYQLNYREIKNLIKVEPYWNVKSEMILNVDNDEKIKVEPYWNVKVGYTFHDEVSERIKVETYWNVKKKQVGTLIL